MTEQARPTKPTRSTRRLTPARPADPAELVEPVQLSELEELPERRKPRAAVGRWRLPPRRRLVGYMPLWLFGVAFSLVIIVPLAYAVLDGFKRTGEVVGSAGLWPHTWVFNNYLDLLTSETFWGEVWNSVVVAAVTVGLVVSCSALAAFVLARITFRGREAVFTLFTIGLLFPSAVAILPLFILLRTLGLLGNPLGVAIPQAAFALPVTIIILRPFFRSIPAELEDAARIDGCSTFGFFWRILLPLSRPALAVVTVLALVTSWNAFFLPLLVFQGSEQWTLPLGVMNFSTQYSSDWAKILAFTSLSMLPAVLFYMVAERQIVSGLTAGSVKG
jgi:raffinose/stachyose/melibiose transport system permease protein